MTKNAVASAFPASLVLCLGIGSSMRGANANVTLECPAGLGRIRAMRFYDRSKREGDAAGTYLPRLMICLHCSRKSSTDDTLVVCRDQLRYTDPVRTHEEGKGTILI